VKASDAKLQGLKRIIRYDSQLPIQNILVRLLAISGLFYFRKRLNAMAGSGEVVTHCAGGDFLKKKRFSNFLSMAIAIALLMTSGFYTDAYAEGSGVSIGFVEHPGPGPANPGENKDDDSDPDEGKNESSDPDEDKDESSGPDEDKDKDSDPDEDRDESSDPRPEHPNPSEPDRGAGPGPSGGGNNQGGSNQGGNNQDGNRQGTRTVPTLPPSNRTPPPPPSEYDFLSFGMEEIPLSNYFIQDGFIYVQDENGGFSVLDEDGNLVGRFVWDVNDGWVWIPIWTHDNLLLNRLPFPWWTLLPLLLLPFLFLLLRKKKVTYATGVEIEGQRGAEGAPGIIGEVYVQIVKHGTKLTVPNAFRSHGYNIEGWYMDAYFDKEWDFNNKVTKNITLYAKWNGRISGVHDYSENLTASS